jgi:hypothetical protein
MSQLLPIKLDMKEVERQFKQFREFLQSRKFFSETEVVNHLKERQHLCCLILFVIYGVPAANLYKFEFQIQGIFLVEFEGGEENSLFGPGTTSQVRDWSRQVGRGFGQLVDWGWAIDDARSTTILKNAFGCSHLAVQFLLVCGRDHGLDQTEQSRLFWRANNVVLQTRPATCLTYDGLLEFFRATIEAIKSCA